MKIFKIPVTWEVWGVMYVEADSLEEAERKAIQEEALPLHGEYVDDSCQLDKESPVYGEIKES